MYGQWPDAWVSAVLGGHWICAEIRIGAAGWVEVVSRTGGSVDGSVLGGTPWAAQQLLCGPNPFEDDPILLDNNLILWKTIPSLLLLFFTPFLFPCPTVDFVAIAT